MVKPLEDFREESYASFNHDLRIFIQGAEVTQDLIGTISCTTEGSNGINSLSFELDNAFDKYIVTKENLEGQFGTDNFGRYSEQAKKQIYNFKLRKTVKDTEADQKDIIKQNVDFFINEQFQNLLPAQVKAYVTAKDIADITKKTTKNLADTFFKSENFDTTVEVITKALNDTFPNRPTTENKKDANDAATKRQNGQVTASTDPIKFTADNKKGLNVKDIYTGADNWEFHDRDPILTQLDTVVVFAANPYSYFDQWFPVFTGFLVEAPFSINYITGYSTLKLNCKDVRYLMSRMRVAQNSILAIQDPEVVYKETDSMFRDLISPNALTVQFSGKSLEEAIAEIMTGFPSLKEPNQSTDPNSANSDTKNKKFGVGDFKVNFKMVKSYPSEKQDPEVGGIAIPFPARAKAGWNDPNCQILEEWNRYCLLGEKDDWYTYDEVSSIGKASSIGNQYSPLNKKVSFLLPKNGTVLKNLLEFAINTSSSNYNFQDRIGIINNIAKIVDYQVWIAPHGDMVVEFPFYDFIPDDFGYWSKVFTFNKHLIDSTILPEKEGIVTGVTVTGGMAESLPQTIQIDPRLIQTGMKVVIYSPKLGTRYGAQTEPLSMPFISDINKLAQYGMFKFQQFLGDAGSLSVNSVFRPFLLPNRPVKNEKEGKMGVTGNITNSWTINKKCDTSYNLRYIRQETFVEGEDLPLYRFLTGGTIMGLSYRTSSSNAGASSSNAGASSSNAGASSSNAGVNNLIPGENISGIRVYPSPGAAQVEAEQLQSLNLPGMTAGFIEELKNTKKDFIPAACEAQVQDASGSGLGVLDADVRQAIYDMSSAACVKIIVTSTKRTPERNDEVKGNKNSPHLTGRAFDARLRTVSASGSVKGIYTDDELKRLVQAANSLGYLVLNETDHLHFQKKRSPKEPDYTVLPPAAERARRKAAKKASR